MLRLALAGLLAGLALTAARAEGACPENRGLSPAQLEKLLAYVRSDIGTSAVFYAPLPADFGWTGDARADVPGREVATDDRRFSFVRSERNGDDYLIAAFGPGGVDFFATHPDLCLARALHRRYGGPPEPLDVRTPQVQDRYSRALRAWASDLDHSPPAPPTAAPDAGPGLFPERPASR